MNEQLSKEIEFSSTGNLDELLHLGEALIQKHLNDGPASKMDRNKVAQVKYSLSVINDKYEEVQRYKKLWQHASKELHDTLENNDRLNKNFRESLEYLVSNLNKGQRNSVKTLK